MYSAARLTRSNAQVQTRGEGLKLFFRVFSRPPAGAATVTVQYAAVDAQFAERDRRTPLNPSLGGANTSSLECPKQFLCGKV